MPTGVEDIFFLFNLSAFYVIRSVMRASAFFLTKIEYEFMLTRVKDIF